MSSFFDEIAAKLATLSGVASPEVSRDELNEFNVRDIQAVRVSEGGGGGSPPTAVAVRVPIAFDTAGMVGTWTRFAISAVDILAASVTVAGDHVAALMVSGKIRIIGSTANDGISTPSSVALSGGDTVITGANVFDPTVDGDVVVWTGGGIELYTPAVGDTLLALDALYFADFPGNDGLGSAIVWDGTTPKLHIVIQVDTPSDSNGNGDDLTDFAPVDLTNSPTAGGKRWAFAAGGSSANQPPSVTLLSTTPIMAMVDDGQTGDPGSAQGSGAVVLHVLKAT